MADLTRRAQELGIDPAFALAIFGQESSSNWDSPNSPKGAIGGMQVMPGTFRMMMGTEDGQDDPWKNMEAGLRYIRYGKDRLKTDDPMLLAAGYHAGYDHPALRAGRIPGTNDGLIDTADYAKSIAKRMGRAPADGDDPTAGLVQLTPEEMLAIESPDLVNGLEPLNEREVSQFQEYLRRTEEADSKGLFEYLGSRGAQGLDDTGLALSGTGWAFGRGTDEEFAEALAQNFQKRSETAKTTGEQKLDAAFQDVSDAKGVFPTLAAAGRAVGTAITNPKALAGEVVGSAANMLPSLGAGAAGAGGGAAIGGAVGNVPGAVTGAIIGGRSGMAAGTTATELGAEVMDMVSKRLQDRGAPPTAQNILAIISEPGFRDEARNQGLKKGLTVAAVDQIFMSIGGKIATAPARKEATRALAEQGIDVSTREARNRALASPAGRKALDEAKPSLGATAAAGGTAVAVDTVGEMAGEGLSQQVARGEVDKGEVLREGVASLGQSVVDVGIGAAIESGKRLRDVTHAPVEAPPSSASGPLRGAIEDAAGEANRVKATAPDGTEVQGTVTAKSADGRVEIVDDDGVPHVVTTGPNGVTITPIEPAGPLTSAVEQAAQDPANEVDAPPAAPVVAPDATQAAEEAPAEQARPAKVDLAAMDDAALRERLDFIANQAKTNGGWNATLVKARRAVEDEIAKRQAAAAPAISESESVTDQRATAEQPTAEQQSATRVSSTLPRELSGAKPRYNYGKKQFELAFESDLDRAAYVIAQDKTSSRDADYLKFVMDATGMDEAGARAYGRQVRDAIKAQAKDASPGTLKVADQRSSAQGETPPVAEAAAAQPDAAPSSGKAAKIPEPKWWTDNTPAQRVFRAKASGFKNVTGSTQWNRLSAEQQRVLDDQWGEKSKPSAVQPDAARTGEEVTPASDPTEAPVKPKTASKEDVEHLFGVDAKREKALERIAAGKAWFNDGVKAKDFIAKNGLKDTHEVAKGKGGRWEVVAKGEPAQAQSAQQQGDRDEGRQEEGRRQEVLSQAGASAPASTQENQDVANERAEREPAGGEEVVQAADAGQVEGASVQSAGAEEVRAERRVLLSEREALTKKLAAMTQEELVEAIEILRNGAMTSGLTALGSKKAWLLRERKPFEASIDADSLKWVNDNMGHQAGDDLLKAIGQALKDAGLEAYHVSGDEFYATSNNRAELEAGLAKAQEALAQAEIKGGELTMRGAGFSFGIAGDINEAEKGLQDDKARREKAGLRAARGERPSGVVETGQSDDAGRTQGGGEEVAGTAPAQGQAEPVEAQAQSGDVSPLTKARNDLIEVNTRIEQQGQVVDDRLLDRQRQLKSVIKELEGEQQPAPVSSTFTGQPDPKNSAPMQELDGFRVGETVNIPSRTFGAGTVEALFTRAMAGMDPMPMARVVRADGKKLDVLTSELEKAPEQESAATAADEPQRDGAVIVPPTVDDAMTRQMDKQKNRLSRMRRDADQPGMTLEEKTRAQTKVKAAEATLRQMRLKRFDAEDAALRAVESGSAAAFAEYSDLFPDAAEAIQALIDAKPTTPPTGGGKPDIFANNKIFTADKVEAARARLKAKLGRLNSGFDPETAMDGMTIAGAYIEAGTRTFAAYAKAMVEDFGDSVKPFLLSFYEAARYYPGLDTDGMSTPENARAQHQAMMMADSEAKKSKPVQAEPQPEQENQDDARGNDAGDAEPLEPQLPAGNQDLASDVAATSGTSVRDPDADGDGRSQGGRGKRRSGVGRGVRPVLSGSPAEVRPVGRSPVSKQPDAQNQLFGDAPANYQIGDDDRIGEGTKGQKLKANMEAIRTLRRIQKENRNATPQEQAIMARFVGWGGLRELLDPKAGKQWADARAELLGTNGQAPLLVDGEKGEEWNALQRSTTAAHYTAPEIVKAMWSAARHFGFAGGRVLEPTSGIGNFIGLQPRDLAASSEWHGAELDLITGQMAKLIYPEASIAAGIGFEDVPFAKGAFDLAIGNPPFGSLTIKSKVPAYKDLPEMKLHNFIIAKTGEHLRPGGVMAMVVTHRFLDTANPEARDHLAKNFRFLGAFRLPNDAFLKNAGTEVTTDVIFLQKLHVGEKPGSTAWLDTEGSITVDGQQIRVNRYYQENPENILGRSAMDGTLYAGRKEKGGEYTVHSDGRDLAKAIEDLIQTKWADLKGVAEATNSDTAAAAVMIKQSDLPVGGVMLDADGNIQRRELNDSEGNAVITTITPQTIWREGGQQWKELLDAARGLRDGKVPREDFVEAARIAYTAKGEKKKSPIKAETAIYEIVDASSQAGFVWSHDEQIKLIEAAVDRKRLGQDGFDRLKGMMSLRNTALSLIEAERTDAPSIDALRARLNQEYDAFVSAYGFISDPKNANLLEGDVGVETGLEVGYQPKTSSAKSSAKKADIFSKRVNFPYREITSAKDSFDGLQISLSERGRLDIPYIAKLTGKSSTEVIKDLSTGANPSIFMDPETNEYVDADRYLSGNVKLKLKKAREARLDANIKALEAVQPEPKTKDNVRPSIRGAWMPASVFESFLQDLGVSSPTVQIIPSQGMILASGSAKETEFGSQFKNEHRTITELFNAAASGKPINIYFKDAQGNSVKNDTATKEVNLLVERMSKVFNEWAWSNDAIVQQVVDAFNEKMNTHVPRQYDGKKYLREVGASPSITLRSTQKNAAWRMIQDQTVLLDHVVGAGKTMTVITGVMQRRRLGLSRKPMIVVPNHLVGQWAREFYQLYPGAKILAATPDDFAKSKRRRLFARIATGDFDAVIIGHSSLGFIETPAADEQMVINEQIKELRDVLNEMKERKESGRTRTQIEERLQKYEKKLEDLQNVRRDEIGIDLESMGVDYIAVDEMHEFKNLEYTTAGERVVGMNDPKGSKKAFDLYIKIRGVLARGGGVTGATGTPVSNSLVELYTMMKYLAYQELVDRQQHNFDAWSGAYARAENKLEYTATQKLKPRRVLAGLNNLSALKQLYEQFADVITMDDLKRLYSEDVRESNKKHGTQKREEFPVPKVAGGRRRLESGPITDAQSLYMDYLVARMQAIEANKKDKEYSKVDNPLYVLTDARHMSLDIRTVDPSAPRDENGKVMRAAANILDTYRRWDADKGTQMVFCDLSTPSKSANKDAKALIKTTIEKLFSEADAKRIKAQVETIDGYQAKWRFVEALAREVAEAPNTDPDVAAKIEEYLDEVENPESIMLTADVGFSVYDDLRQVLIEGGIPESEIAFIHDYETPDQKAKLFADVNEGRIRILMGSSAKMGAGTNAQKRLVALHHMDAPWRPSDVEQREGRIIRQGNMLYDRDPEGFEVEIVSYSTAGTSDAVMWQILERKARAIEEFRKAGLDTTEEDGADSDQYAEFMAQSTGNPVFRLKLEAERRADVLDAETRGDLMAKTQAQRWLDQFESRMAASKAGMEYAASVTADTIKVGSETGTAEDYQKALKAARDQYNKDYEAFLAKKAEADAKLAEWNELPEDKRGDKPKMPTAPSMPGPLSKPVLEASGYARAIKEALSRGTKSGQTGYEFEVGGAKFRIRQHNFNESDWLLDSWDGTRWYFYEGASSQSAENSGKLAAALSPSAIMDEMEHIRAQFERDAKALADDLAVKQRIAAKDVDRSELESAREVAQWYRIQVAFAEQQADMKRAQRPNRYVTGDRRRPLTQAQAELGSTSPVKYGDETFTPTGFASGRYRQARGENGREVILDVKDDKVSEVIEKPSGVQFDGIMPPALPSAVVLRSRSLPVDGGENDRLPEVSGVSAENASAEPVSSAGQRPRNLVARGLGISDRIARSGVDDLIGASAATPEDVADAAQVFRDPRYETFRVLFTRDGKIVGGTGISSRLPGSTPIHPAGVDQANFYSQTLKSMMEAHQADGYWIVHNHPSGDPTPSDADKAATQQIRKWLPGMRGHVIVNSNRFAVIRPGGGGQVITRDFGPDTLLQASMPHDLLGRDLSSTGSVAGLAKSLQLEGGYVTLVGVDANAKIRAVFDLRSDTLKNPSRVRAAIRAFARRTGSEHVIAVVREGDLVSADLGLISEGFLFDMVSSYGDRLRTISKMKARDGYQFGQDVFAGGRTVLAAGTEPEKPAQPGLTPDDQGFLRRAQQTFQDNLNRVLQVQERIAKITGRKPPEYADYYGAETNRPGRIAARLEDAEDKLFGPLMARLAKSGHTPEQLERLLHAQHAQERNEAVAKINEEYPDGGSGMMTAEAEAILAENAQNKELMAIAKQARDIAKRTLEMKRAYGLIDQETYDALAGRYEFYVPLKGDGEFGPKIKRAMGHDARDERILENIARDYEQAVVVGERNFARQRLLQMVLENPDPKLWTVGMPPKGRYVAGRVFDVYRMGEKVASFDSEAQAKAWVEGRTDSASMYNIAIDVPKRQFEVKKDGKVIQTFDSHSKAEDYISAVKDPAHLFEINAAEGVVREFVKPLQDNEVMVYVEGRPVRIQINGDETLARQLRPLDQGRMNTILEFMRTHNRYLARIYTGYNPAFILVNLSRDLMSGTVNIAGNQGLVTAGKAWANYPAAMKAMTQWAATKKTPPGEAGKWLQEYRAQGGKTGASWMSDLEEQGETLQRMYDDAYGARRFARDGRVGKAAWIAARKGVLGLAHVVEIMNQATENGLRLALYMALRKDGVSPAQAAQAAKTVTVNFDRKGTMTPALGAIYLFFNPAVQGAANAIRTLFKGEKKGQAWLLLGALTALGFWAASAGMDDDEDRWLGRDWDQRSKNLMINIGGHDFRLPLTLEFAPFYSVGVAMAEASRGEDTMKSALRIVSSFLNAYFPLQGIYRPDSDNYALDAVQAAVPTVLRAPFDSAVNRNDFGSQIVPESPFTKDKPDNLKMNRATTNTVYDSAAQGIAQAGQELGFGRFENDITKVSPETLKHYWRTYTGGLGMFITDTIGVGVMAGQDAGQIAVGDVPIVKSFVRGEDVKPIRSRFYQLADEAKAASTEFRQAKKAADDEAIGQIMRDPKKAELIGLERMIRKTTEAATNLRDQAVEVNANESLSPSERRAALKEIERQEEELYRAALDAFRRP